MIGPLFDWGDALRAEKVRRAKLNRRIAALGVFVGLTQSPAIFLPLPRLVWNASASAPIGLYSVSPGVPADPGDMVIARVPQPRSEAHTPELQSLMRTSYAVSCLKKKMTNH